MGTGVRTSGQVSPRGALSRSEGRLRPARWAGYQGKRSLQAAVAAACVGKGWEMCVCVRGYCSAGESVLAGKEQSVLVEKNEG